MFLFSFALPHGKTQKQKRAFRTRNRDFLPAGGGSNAEAEAWRVWFVS